MGKITLPDKAKLFCAVFSGSSGLIGRARNELEIKFGRIDLQSAEYDFSRFTAYYSVEMGEALKKIFFAFEPLINREEIAGIKLWANELELSLSGRDKRAVNIDPGYLTMPNVTLATTKDYQHRIYIGRGIYLENTLRFDSKKQSYDPYRLTYSDYKSEEAVQFFNGLRDIYRGQLK